MTIRPTDPARVAALLAALLWVALFSLASARGARADPAAPGDVLARAFGSLRLLAARHAYREADRFFHRGIGHLRTASFDDPLQRLRRTLAPALHEHLPDADAVELMPWLRWTVAADPTNVEAWLVAVFWLNSVIRRPDLARLACREALAANPGDYRPYLQWARLLLQDGLWGPAARVCDRALARWPAPLAADDPDARLDRARLLEWRGYLWAFAGERDRAESALAEVAALRPEHQLVRIELQRLQSGAAPPGEIGPGLRHLRRAPEPYRPICEDPSDDHDHP